MEFNMKEYLQQAPSPKECTSNSINNHVNKPNKHFTRECR
ncbi:hypothetical protein NHP164001_18550 [Helicobacter trogontum]|uniref:Uncharacterized protein n=1 Tax=Helicobacter trogontum TaxID=50960 RepID=A0ABQ0D649_9HELI